MAPEEMARDPGGQVTLPGMRTTEHLDRVIPRLRSLRCDLIGVEARFAETLQEIPARNQASARNLLHYVALRRHDLRDLQEQLARLGLSSLGRAESCVLANLDAVLQLLFEIKRQPWPQNEFGPPASDFEQGKLLLRERTEQLLGPERAGRTVRIMVTMPSEAADNYPLVRDLLAAGMDCMRVNCAHDDPAAWGRMIAHLRQAESELGQKCRILMDLGGPKLRTGPIEPGPRVLKWRPERNVLGQVTAPARIWLTPEEEPLPPPGPATATLLVPGAWLASQPPGTRIRFTDARQASRSLRVMEAIGTGRWAEARRTAYVIPGLTLTSTREGKLTRASVGVIPPRNGVLILQVGDTLILTREIVPGRNAERDREGKVIAPARIGCTLPEIFRDVKPGDRIYLDDGKIGGVIRAVTAEQIEVAITQARPGGDKLAADKGINLPDTHLHLPALTRKDIEDLQFVAAHADMVGFSFVHEASDVRDLHERLAQFGESRPAVVLKIETQRAFENLPKLLLVALLEPFAGVMIARGDLAVECGYARLAEVQEEILWLCEAAHIPAIWATQVLEQLAKAGTPSRAEVTDAAMGVRAECVMLNKGPHIVEAIRSLSDILHRMEAHQSKKRPMLRLLRLADRFMLE